MRNKLLNWVIIIVGIVLIVNFTHSILDLSKKGGVVDEAEERLREVEEENALLRERYRQVRREEYIEKIAREELNLARDGEVVVVLPKEKNQESGITNQEKESAEKQSFWKGLIERIF